MSISRAPLEDATASTLHTRTPGSTDTPRVAIPSWYPPRALLRHNAVRELASEFCGGVSEQRLQEEVQTAISQLEGSAPAAALPELVTRLVSHRVGAPGPAQP